MRIAAASSALALALLGLTPGAFAQTAPAPTPTPAPTPVPAPGDAAVPAAGATGDVQPAPPATPQPPPSGGEGTVTSPAPQPLVPAPPAPPPAQPQGLITRSSDFMDTRLSFTCTQEDFFRDPTVLPAAPGFRCGRPNQLGILFFDNYDTRYSGYETLTHAALYKHYNVENWDVEGGFIVRLNELSEDNIKMSDGGSYIRAAWWFDPKRESKKRLALVAFPVSSDRMRLGYSYRISWGGSPEFFKANPDAPGSAGKNSESTPGAKLQYDADNLYAYVGLKSSLLLDPTINEKRSVLAYLAGAGVDVTPMLRIEANGGAFDRGKNENFDVLGEPVWLYGASVQVAVHKGMPVGSSIDYALYRNEPESVARLFKKESYAGGLSWLVQSEATAIWQTLKDSDETGSTTTQTGYAGDVNVRVKYNYTRLKFDLETRDLAYILHTIPSLPTYADFPSSYDVASEIYGAVGADQFFPKLGITAGATLGAMMPATLKAETASDIPGNTTESATIVIRNSADRSTLPAGEDAALIWALKGTARYDFAESFAAIVDLYFQYDPNTVRYDREGADTTFEPEFAEFKQLGFNATLQARF